MLNVTTTTNVEPIEVNGSRAREEALRRLKQLTPREYEITLRVARGQRPEQMSRELGISKKTISTHRLHALERLCLHTTSEVAILAYVAGLVPCP